jgi:hypothetical protein
MNTHWEFLRHQKHACNVWDIEENNLSQFHLICISLSHVIPTRTAPELDPEAKDYPWNCFVVK